MVVAKEVKEGSEDDNRFVPLFVSVRQVSGTEV